MSSTIYNVFGYFATVGFALMYIPQINKAWESKKTGDLSWGMLVLQFGSTCCSVVYSVGVYKEGGLAVALPMFIGNPLVIINVTTLMYLKMRYD